MVEFRPAGLGVWFWVGFVVFVLFSTICLLFPSFNDDLGTMPTRRPYSWKKSSDRVSCFRHGQHRNLFALDSSTRRLGGKAHGAGDANPVSVGVGSSAKSSGNGTKATSQCRGLLNRQSFSLGDSSPFRFREGDTKASRSAKTE